MPHHRPPDPVERILVAAQALGGLAFALAWLLGGDARGWRSAGLALLVAGLLLGVAGVVALGRSFRIGPTPRRGARLIQSGIYRWLRHPMYAAVLLALGGGACLRPTGPVLLITALNFILYFVKARYEEAVLLEHYPGYARYRETSLGVRPAATRDDARDE